MIYFTTERGNGWITLRNNKVIEAFQQQQAGKFNNLLTNENIVLAKEKLIISDVISCQNSSYTIVFYGDQQDSSKHSTTLFILNRTLI